MTNLNKSYEESQAAVVKKLVETAKYDKGTAHGTLSAAALTVPENITEESMRQHVKFIIDTTGTVEAANAQLGVQAYKDNNKITKVDSTLSWGGVEFNAAHDTVLSVGEDKSYGVSSAAATFTYAEEQTAWLEQTREHIATVAKGLFD